MTTTHTRNGHADSFLCCTLSIARGIHLENEAFRIQKPAAIRLGLPVEARLYLDIKHTLQFTLYYV